MKSTKAPLVLGLMALIVEYVAIISPNQASLTMAAQAGGYNHTPYAVLAKVLSVVGVLLALLVLGLTRKTHRFTPMLLSILLVVLCVAGAIFAWSVSSRVL
jgi:cytochrome bd-type quinol oxidase subunit 2